MADYLVDASQEIDDLIDEIVNTAEDNEQIIRIAMHLLDQAGLDWKVQLMVAMELGIVWEKA